MLVCLRCLLHHILSLIAYTFRENRDFVFIIFVQFIMNANNRIRFGWQIAFGFVLFFCSLHHLIIIIVQAFLKTLNLKNACQIYFVECVSKIEHILSVIHYAIYGAVCFQFPIPLLMNERIHTLSYYHHQFRSMDYHPLLRISSWNNGMRCMSPHILLMETEIMLYSVLVVLHTLFVKTRPIWLKRLQLSA